MPFRLLCPRLPPENLALAYAVVGVDVGTITRTANNISQMTLTRLTDAYYLGWINQFLISIMKT